MHVNMNVIKQRSRPNNVNTAFTASRPPFKPANSAPAFSAPTPSLTVTAAAAPRISSTSTGTHAGLMDLSWGGRRGRLTVEEKERRNRLGIRRYCGQAGHFAMNFSQTKQRGVGIKEIDLACASKQVKVQTSSQVALEGQ